MIATNADEQEMVMLFLLLWLGGGGSRPAGAQSPTTSDQVLHAACQKVHFNVRNISDLIGQLTREGEFDVSYKPDLHDDPDIPDQWPGKYVCGDYINQNKTYGPVGRYLFANVGPDVLKDFSSTQNHRDLEVLCPAYFKMSTLQRRRFMLWVMTSMALYEDSCGKFKQKKLGKGPNGTLASTFQLHFGEEQKYTVNCRKWDSCDKRTSAMCAASTLNRDLHNNGELFASYGSTYWDVLVKGSAPAMRNCENIAKYKACGNSEQASSARSYKKICNYVLLHKGPRPPQPAPQYYHPILRITITPNRRNR